MLPESGAGKILKITLSWKNDNAGAEQAARGARKIKDEAGKAGAEARQASSALDRMGNTAGKMASAGAALGLAFGLPFRAMLSSAQNYVQQVGTTETASRRWLGSQKAIEESQLRIGRVIAEQAAPFMEKLADLAEQTADFVEEHPDAIKAALAVTGSVTAIASLLGAAAAVLKTAEVVGKLFAAGKVAGAVGAGASAGAAGAGAAGGGLLGLLGVAAGGVGAGLLGYDQLAKNFGLGGGTRLNQFATVAAYGWGSVFGGEEKGLAWAKAVGEFTGAIEKTGQASRTAGREIDFTSQEINAYIGYIRQEQVAERQRGIQLQRMQRDFERQQAIEQQDFDRQRSRTLRDFHRQQAYAENDYYRQRALRARDFNVETQRMEEDHQKELRRAKEDHEFQMWDILRSGDALAYMRSQRQYEITRQRSEEDYQTQARRRNEDFAREVADQEREFQIQRQRQLEEFKIRLADEDADFKLRRARAQEQHRLQLSDMQRDFEEQRLMRRQALIDQLRDMRGALEQERILRREFTAAMLNDLRSAIRSGEEGTNLVAGSRDAGGYTADGVYRMHNREFVLSASTTQEFERAANGHLTQQKALAALSGQQLVYNDNRQFGAEVSDAFRIQIMRDTEQALITVVDALRTKTLMAGG